MQKYAKNTDYEILTPNGWEDFEGVILNENAFKASKKLCFSDGSFIIATLEHRFYRQGLETKVEHLTVGDELSTIDNVKTITAIEDVVLQDTYDIFNATNHIILTNGTLSHQCDEYAFVAPTISHEFWTSISPTLATGGKAIITSTPNSDEDMFATIWKDANNRFDEYGNETELGSNGFFPFRAYWYEHPDRDEEWKRREIGKIGLEKFTREYACLAGDTLLTLEDHDGVIHEMTVEDLFVMLGVERA